jgi:hypothetical protein
MQIGAKDLYLLEDNHDNEDGHQSHINFAQQLTFHSFVLDGVKG